MTDARPFFAPPEYGLALQSIEAVAQTARRFIPAGSGFVSLGQNCTTAWYLKAIGCKLASFPFDWIFSSPDVVADCLEDDFVSFLDPRLVTQADRGAAGHRRYHARMFNHRNPAASPVNFEYYRRCVARFRDLCASERPIAFLSTMLPEHSKRPSWATGFTQGFALPTNRDARIEYAHLQRVLERRRAPTRLVVVGQLTEQPQPSLRLVACSDTLVALELASAGPNDGVRYLDPLDDELCKALYGALCRPRRE